MRDVTILRQHLDARYESMGRVPALYLRQVNGSRLQACEKRSKEDGTKEMTTELQKGHCLRKELVPGLTCPRESADMHDIVSRQEQLISR